MAFYGTDALNTLKLLDGWFKYKEEQIAGAQPFQVVLHPHVGIDLSSLEDDLSYACSLILPHATLARLQRIRANATFLVFAACFCLCVVREHAL